MFHMGFIYLTAVDCHAPGPIDNASFSACVASAQFPGSEPRLGCYARDGLCAPLCGLSVGLEAVTELVNPSPARGFHMGVAGMVLGIIDSLVKSLCRSN